MLYYQHSIELPTIINEVINLIKKIIEDKQIREGTRRGNKLCVQCSK